METFLSFLLRGLLLFSVAISSTVAAPTSAADAAVTVLAPKQISRSELTQLIKRGRSEWHPAFGRGACRHRARRFLQRSDLGSILCRGWH